MVELLPDIHEALGVTPSTTKRKKLNLAISEDKRRSRNVKFNGSSVLCYHVSKCSETKPNQNRKTQEEDHEMRGIYLCFFIKFFNGLY